MDQEKNKVSIEKGITGYQVLRKTKLEANKKKRIFAYIKCGQTLKDKTDGR